MGLKQPERYKAIVGYVGSDWRGLRVARATRNDGMEKHAGSEVLELRGQRHSSELDLHGQLVVWVAS